MDISAAVVRLARRFGAALMLAALVLTAPMHVAVAQDAPWRQPGGRECFADWVYLAMSQLNAFDGDPAFNAGKPFRIDQYGMVVDKNDRSNVAPDDWPAYRDRDARIWGRFRADPDRGWRWPEWNLADVPHLGPFIRDCLERNRSAGAEACLPCDAPPDTVAAPAPAPVTDALREACDDYARRAVVQSQDHRRRACRTGQPEWWSTDAAYHQRWCLGRPTNPLPSEARIMRDRALLQCGAAAKGTATTTAAQPGRRWCELANNALPGHNRERHRDQSVGECKALCEGRSWCASFDYHRKSRYCQLSDKSGGEVPPQPQPDGQWDFHTRDCAALGR